MNRRTFIISSFMFGLLLAVGVKPKHVPERQRPASVWINNCVFSFDRGATWTDVVPPNGTPIERIYSPRGTYVEQTNPMHMPSLHAKLIGPNRVEWHASL
jgi:hypothetical protein